MFFVIEFILSIASYQFFKHDWIFINHGLYLSVKYSLKFYSIPISKISTKSYSFKILLTIPATKKFSFKIKFSRVVENIFPEKISHYL